jgi:hypothetical protein
MSYELILSQTDGRPMYLQIVDQIKRIVAIGDWPADYKLLLAFFIIGLTFYLQSRKKDFL